MPGIIEIYSGTLWEAEMLKSMLADVGISSFLKNSVLNTYWYDPIRSEGVKIMIDAKDEAQAQIIVSEFESNRKS